MVADRDTVPPTDSILPHPLQTTEAGGQGHGGLLGHGVGCSLPHTPSFLRFGEENHVLNPRGWVLFVAEVSLL